MSIQNLKSINKHHIKLKKISLSILDINKEINEIKNDITSDSINAIVTEHAIKNYVENQIISITNLFQPKKIHIIKTAIFSGPIPNTSIDIHFYLDTINKLCQIVFPSLLINGNNISSNLYSNNFITGDILPAYNQSESVITLDDDDQLLGVCDILITGDLIYKTVTTNRPIFKPFTACLTKIGFYGNTITYKSV